MSDTVTSVSSELYTRDDLEIDDSELFEHFDGYDPTNVEVDHLKVSLLSVAGGSWSKTLCRVVHADRGKIVYTTWGKLRKSIQATASDCRGVHSTAEADYKSYDEKTLPKQAKPAKLKDFLPSMVFSETSDARIGIVNEPSKDKNGNIQPPNKYVRSTLIAIDVDNAEEKDKPLPADQMVTMEMLLERLPELEIVAYSSASSHKAWPRFRAVLPLSRPITDQDDYKRFWAGFNELLKARKIVNDESTSDPNRRWYVPALGNESRYQQGRPVDVDKMIALAPEEKVRTTTSTTASGKPKTTSKEKDGSSIFDEINKVPMFDVAQHLGMDLSACPGCGSTEGAGIIKHPTAGIDLWHCFHNTCAAKRNWNNVSLIVYAKNVDDGDGRGKVQAVATVARALGYDAAIEKIALIPRSARALDLKPHIDDIAKLLLVDNNIDGVILDDIAEQIADHCSVKKKMVVDSLKATIKASKASGSTSKPSKGSIVLGVLADYEIIRAETGRYFSVVNGCYVPTDSGEFYATIAKAVNDTDERKVVKKVDIEDAMRVVVGGDVRKTPVPIRFAQVGKQLVLDLGSKYVIMDNGEATVSTTTPVPFYRPSGFEQLPEPVIPDNLEKRREALEAFKALLSVDDPDWVAILAFLFQAMRSSKEYTALNCKGIAGSGKTCRAEMIRNLIDPRTPSMKALPRKEEDLLIASEQQHVLGLDNLRRVHPEMSDALCRIATGAGMEKRTLYSNRDLEAFKLSRPIIATSIADSFREPDLLSRCLTIEFKKPEIRLTDDKLKAKYEALRPMVLGALCQVLAVSLMKPLEEVSTEIRMQAPCAWAKRCEEDAGLDSGAIEAAYKRSAERCVFRGIAIRQNAAS